MEKLLYKERVRDEKRHQRDKERLLKIKNADKDRRSKEYAAKAEQRKKEEAIAKAEQKKQLASFKRKHPLEYNKIKKYLREDGTLNEAGQALYFGNGKKKKIYQMSTEDLKKTTERLYAEKNYKQAQYELHKNDPMNRVKSAAGETLINSGIAFSMDFLGRSAKSAKNNTFSADAKSNARKSLAKAAEAGGITLTRKMGLSGKKGNKGFNAFEGFSNALKIEDIKPREKSERQKWLDSQFNNYYTNLQKNERTSARKEYGKLWTELGNANLSDDRRQEIIRRLDEISDREPEIWYR